MHVLLVGEMIFAINTLVAWSFKYFYLHLTLAFFCLGNSPNQLMQLYFILKYFKSKLFLYINEYSKVQTF